MNLEHLKLNDPTTSKRTFQLKKKLSLLSSWRLKILLNCVIVGVSCGLESAGHRNTCLASLYRKVIVVFYYRDLELHDFHIHHFYFVFVTNK